MGRSNSRQSADTTTTTTYNTDYSTVVNAGLTGAEVNNLATTFAQSFLILEKDLSNKNYSSSASISPYAGGIQGSSQSDKAPPTPFNYTYILLGGMGLIAVLLLVRR